MASDHFFRLLTGVPIIFVLGCSYVDAPLNNEKTPIESRIVNRTRSALFANVAPPATNESVSMLRTEHVVRSADDGADGPHDKDGFFVGLALSGGGSRSANFTAATMFQLERLGLLQKVDYISSVSGGSLTAAYYCSSDQWDPATVQQRLTHPFSDDMIGRSLLPWNFAAFLFSDWDRSDVLAGALQDVLFSRNGKPLTYADLRADRPRLLINATELQTGRRFVFCNESFDELNADLSRYPLAYAVTASSAVPVLLHPVTLRDFSTTFPMYHHLIDGGVIDNLGVQTLLEMYTSQIESAKRVGRADPYPHGAVIVVVNAQTRFNANVSALSDVGLFASLKAAAGLSSTQLISRASSATLAEAIVNSAPDEETAAELREQIRVLDKEGFLRLTGRTGHPVRVIYISLAQLDALANLPSRDFSRDINSIQTDFDISLPEAFDLYKAADLLVGIKLQDKVRDVVHEIDAAATQPATQP